MLFLLVVPPPRRLTASAIYKSSCPTDCQWGDVSLWTGVRHSLPPVASIWNKANFPFPQPGLFIGFCAVSSWTSNTSLGTNSIFTEQSLQSAAESRSYNLVLCTRPDILKSQVFVCDSIIRYLCDRKNKAWMDKLKKIKISCLRINVWKDKKSGGHS